VFHSNQKLTQSRKNNYEYKKPSERAVFCCEDTALLLYEKHCSVIRILFQNSKTNVNETFNFAASEQHRAQLGNRTFGLPNHFPDMAHLQGLRKKIPSL
jgi:hypothetical protein